MVRWIWDIPENVVMEFAGCSRTRMRCQVKSRSSESELKLCKKMDGPRRQ
jgi:hypothetical protein